MDYLSRFFVDDVYDSLLGNLVQDACVPGVENLFAEGSLCDRAYDNLYSAYQKLLNRLNVENDDADIETIISSLLTISKQLGTAMYHCGAKFALQAADIPSDPNAQERVV